MLHHIRPQYEKLAQQVSQQISLLTSTQHHTLLLTLQAGDLRDEAMHTIEAARHASLVCPHPRCTSAVFGATGMPMACSALAAMPVHAPSIRSAHAAGASAQERQVACRYRRDAQSRHHSARRRKRGGRPQEHQRLRQWLQHFLEVATGYLPNYLGWRWAVDGGRIDAAPGLRSRAIGVFGD